MTFDSQSRLDLVDWRLLELLQEDARLTFAELGRRVSLSSPAVAERVRRLEQVGVLTGYHAEVDVAKLGFPMQAVIRIIARARLPPQIRHQPVAIPEVLACQAAPGRTAPRLRAPHPRPPSAGWASPAAEQA